jgi:hypothetical protein
MGRMSKSKGKRGERECAAELAAVLGVTARRGVQYQGSTDSPDVIVEGLPVHVEAKRVERLALWPAIDQAVADAGEKVPMVWHRCNRRESVVIVRTCDLARLVEALHFATTGRPEPAKVAGPSVNC